MKVQPLVLGAMTMATAAGLSGRLDAAVATSEAFDNSTVQPAGPRTNPNNQNFFNMEGTPAFASFGVADFHGSDFNFGGAISTINSMQLKLTEANAAFTAPGALRFYLTQDTTTGIDSGSSTLTYQSAGAPNGLGTQLDPKTVVGTGTVSTTGNVNNGQVDTYTLTLSPADQTYLIGRLNSGQNFRLIVAPDDSTVAATFAGFNNSTTAGPTVAIDAAVPEPATIGLLLGLAPLMLRRRTV